MVAVIVTVDLARYRGTVHYANCHCVTNYSTHLNRTVPPSIKMAMCTYCKPNQEDIVSIADEINWLEKHSDAMSVLVIKPYDDFTEENVARGSLHGERIRAGRTGFGDR
jgi:hypothetical protein